MDCDCHIHQLRLLSSRNNLVKKDSGNRSAYDAEDLCLYLDDFDGTGVDFGPVIEKRAKNKSLITVDEA